MSEKKLYQDFKKKWPYYIKRIELKTEGGIPDCHLVNQIGMDIFLELKYLPKKFQEAVLPIKKNQFIWHSEYSGRHSYILFQVADDYFLFKKKNIFKLRGRIKWSYFNYLITMKTKDLIDIINLLK